MKMRERYINNFILELEEESNEIERLVMVHREFKDLFSKQGLFDLANDLMKKFIEEKDISVLRSILIITKPFKEHEIIGGTRKEILKIVEDKLGKLA